MKVCPECERQYGEDVDYCAHDGAELRPVDDDSGDPLLGRVLDERWRIQEKIGEGGMGTIYLASQKSVDREVVVKTLRATLSDNEEFSDRFMQEARVTSTINHPHCVTIFDFGQADNNTLYLAMEYLDGAPLADRLEEGPIEMRTALQIGMQVASALSAAHEHGVVHRDLKPENIFLLDIPDGSTFVKVLDFGISKDLDADEDITQTGQLFGTPRYMSPEQCRGDELDGRSDLYSLGCILFEMLAGRTPFVGEQSMEILVQHVREEVPDLAEVADRELPERTVELVMGLLHKEPGDRPEAAGEVRRRLDGILTDWVGSESGEQQSGEETGGTAPGIGPDLGRAATVTPHQADARPEPSGALDEVETAKETPEVVVGDPPQTRGARSSRAGASDEETWERSGEDWVGRHRGLLVALASLAMLTGVLVCGGGGYLVYMQATSEGEGPMANLFGVGTDAGPRTAGAETTAGTDSGDAPSRGEERGSGEDDEEDDEPSRAAASPGESGTGAKEPTSAPSSEGRSVDGAVETEGAGSPTEAGGEREGRSTGRSGASDGDASGGPRAPEPAGSEGASSAEDVTESGDEDAGATSPSREERAATPEKGEEESGPPEGEEPPSRMPDPASFVERSSFSVTGSACNRSDVQQTLASAEERLGRCYRDRSGSGSRQAGSIMLEWNISTEGGTLSASVLKSDFSGGSLSGCVLQHIRQLQFPAPDGGRCYARVTFDFHGP